MQHYGVRILLMCFVLASLMLPLVGERHSLAQQSDYFLPFETDFFRAFAFVADFFRALGLSAGSAV